MTTTTTHVPSTDVPAGDARVSGGTAARLFVPAFWGTLAIVAMWLAVLFDGVFGSDMVFNNTNGMTTIPSAVLVALFAVIGTASVAKRAFRSKND
jgi:hypothetical protein